MSSRVCLFIAGCLDVVWAGIGAVGAAIGGVLLFGESKSLPRILCILRIVAGAIGLKLFSEPEVA